MMKKYISLVLAAAIALTLTACNNSSTSGSSNVDNSAATESSQPDSGASAATAEAPAEPSGSGDTKLLSNPIALNSEGDIDMDVALEYQTDFDALKASFEAKEVDPTKPVSENSNETTLEVWNYLRSVYGKQVLTCQQMMGNECYEDLVFYNASNDLTAMKGFDFIFCTGSYQSDDMITEAIEWSKESGGLVTFTWHWNVPKDIDNPAGGYAFYTEEITNFSQINAVTPGTKEYELVIHDIDLIATKLQQMESEGVTVLFRPLHEASGAWFWWGIQNKESAINEVFQKLWYMIYDRLENYHKLTNIIWVWNGQSQHCAIHPNSFDIAGVDRYYTGEDTSAEALNEYYNSCYQEAIRMDSYCAKLVGKESTGKMLTLSECGYIPDPKGCVDNNNMWLYYMVWNGDFIYETDASGNARVDLNGTPYPNTKRVTNEMIAAYFENDAYITLRKLPEFSFGTREIPQQIKNWEYFKIG